MSATGEYGRLLGPQGPLARMVAGFESRREQQQMADWVGEALETRGMLAIEAGTGTGKTYAYLVPTLVSGRQVILSTGTRTLQDQLFNRDLPTVAAALGRPARVALLKGRANYLCLHRLELAETMPQLPGLPAPNARMLARIRRWSRETRTGDLAEVRSLRDTDPVRVAVTSTRENCLGASCPAWSRCHVVAARREAQAADVVVVNHHLLLADLAMKDEGFGELLPGAQAVILDEAHQVPEIAAQFFGLQFSARQGALLARDALAELTRLGLAGYAKPRASRAARVGDRGGDIRAGRRQGPRGLGGVAGCLRDCRRSDSRIACARRAGDRCGRSGRPRAQAGIPPCGEARRIAGGKSSMPVWTTACDTQKQAVAASRSRSRRSRSRRASAI